jgi:hypothetical protein
VYIFAPNPKTPLLIPKVKHAIYIGNILPIKQHKYRLSPTENEKAMKEIKKMLDNKIIRKLQSL